MEVPAYHESFYLHTSSFPRDVYAKLCMLYKANTQIGTYLKSKCEEEEFKKLNPKQNGEKRTRLIYLIFFPMEIVLLGVPVLHLRLNGDWNSHLTRTRSKPTRLYKRKVTHPYRQRQTDTHTYKTNNLSRNIIHPCTIWSHTALRRGWRRGRGQGRARGRGAPLRQHAQGSTSEPEDDISKMSSPSSSSAPTPSPSQCSLAITFANYGSEINF